MKSRALASAALGAAILLGSTGCAMISPQSTTLQYAPGEGMNVRASGPVEVRNALIVANERGTVGNFVAAIVNPTTEAQLLSLRVGEGPAAIDATIRVPAATTLSLGQDQSPLRLDGIDTKPGATIPVYFQSGAAEGSRVAIPVLDGQLDYLRDLVPVVPGDVVVIETPAPTPSHATTESSSGGH